MDDRDLMDGMDVMDVMDEMDGRGNYEVQSTKYEVKRILDSCFHGDDSGIAGGDEDY